ncbi:phage major capsid protein [Mesorhizobium sp.]|uniref:phage major capsid protein n=1 Tax=Mesorhizobium sp. TaxID=1871066 RepID=UPI0025F7FF93|nr:phage major capsid protein [Mesorhizobium sp.]
MDALKARDTEIQTFATKASEEIKTHGKVLDETRAALTKLSTDGASLQDRLLQVEQKLSRRSFSDLPAKSIGEQLTETDDFKALQSKGRGTARLNLKAATITSATTDAAGSAGDLIRPDRAPGIITPAVRELTIRDLLLPGRTSSNAIEFMQETGFTNNAAPVAEGAAKPQSDLKFELITTNVRTIAHWFAASKQVLADVPMLMSYINGRATFGLKYVEEAQLLAGDGTGQNLHGVIPQATAFSQANSNGTLDTRIDTIRRASLQVRNAEYRPTFVVLNPNDWAEIELTKDGENRYIWIQVQTGGTMQLWRLAVVETTAISTGEFLVGATMGAQVFDREDAAVEVSTDHDDFFVRNLVAIRAEERLALAVNRPESFVHGYFDLASSPPLNAV